MENVYTSTTSSQKKSDQQQVTLLVYENVLRTELLSTINVKAGQANASEFHSYERGIAILTSSFEQKTMELLNIIRMKF
jgi:hypothetical protein